jgi:hypothetical protein
LHKQEHDIGPGAFNQALSNATGRDYNDEPPSIFLAFRARYSKTRSLMNARLILLLLAALSLLHAGAAAESE